MTPWLNSNYKSILEKPTVKPCKMLKMHLFCFELMQNVHFNLNMDNFEFIVLSRGQLEGQSFDKFFLTVFKLLTYYEFFFFFFWGGGGGRVFLFLPSLLDYSVETIFSFQHTCSLK